MALKGLVIRQPWISLILEGKKTWEMRSQPCRYRGRIALIEKGTGLVVGLADVVNDLPPQSHAQMSANFQRHRIPSSELAEAMSRRWVRPWVLQNVRRLPRPVRYTHTSGGHWVNLSVEEERAILAAGIDLKPVATVAPKQIDQVTQEHRIMAKRVLAEISRDNPGYDIPHNAVPSLSRSGNKLFINVEWDHYERGAVRRSSQSLTAGIAVFGTLLSMFCTIGFSVHLTIGMFSESVSALNSFKWLLPVFMGAALSGWFGQPPLRR